MQVFFKQFNIKSVIILKEIYKNCTWPTTNYDDIFLVTEHSTYPSRIKLNAGHLFLHHSLIYYHEMSITVDWHYVHSTSNLFQNFMKVCVCQQVQTQVRVQSHWFPQNHQRCTSVWSVIFIVQLLYFCSAKSGWSVMISECCLNVLNGCLIVWVKDEDLFMNIFKLFQETVIELVQ